MKPLYINQKTNSRHIKLDCKLWDIEKVMIELNAKILPENLQLSRFEMIKNVRKFIDINADMARYNNGNTWFKPYFERLQKVNDILTLNSI